MSDFSIHFLDVGAYNYGDSVLCVIGGKTILIDGGTPRSDRASQSNVLGDDIDHEPIQDQVRALLGQTGAVKVDLLVVTHCHSDHMGCLPALVETGKLKCTWALLADPQLGYGITGEDDEPPPPDEMTPRDKLWLALREEPLFDASDEAIQAFIEDSAQEYQGYVTFVNKLTADLGSKCVIYRGLTADDSPGLTALLEEFDGTGLHVYGPTHDLLLACAERLLGRSEDLIDDAMADAPATLVQAYRSAVDVLAAADAEDSADGAAVNCQSLVMRIGPDDHRVLLTGDMQFASPSIGTTGTADVKALSNLVKADGTFECVKLSHHGATNGQNKALLQSWGAKRLVISTGSTSSKHPTEPTLTALEALESGGTQWARVDMNGRCTFSVTSGQATLVPERLALNDATRPAERTGDVAVTGSGALSGAGASTSPAIRVGTGPSDGEMLEVRVRIPNRRTRVTFSIEVDPADGGPFVESTSRQPADARMRRLGGGRELPRLLLVTDAAALADRIGRADADAVLAAVAAARQPLVNRPRAGLLAEVRRVLNRDRSIKGVVLIGGYDVVPSQIVNAAPRELGGRQVRDRDRLQVWSDDGYGDRDDDGVPEVPVSRVPDGGSRDLLWTALGTSPPGGVPHARSGIRNIRRPFAEEVFVGLPGSGRLYTSEPTAPDLPPFRLGGEVLYLMLHGSSSDTSVFTGEDQSGEYPVALSVSEVPSPCPPVVFAGCCYGALIADAPARDAQPGETVAGRRAADSIALTCLARGANAFVGCTGVHYSPTRPPLTYFGEPMHRAFVSHVRAGQPPALALWSAKVDYARGIPHRGAAASVEEIAYENKILRQFTCLGLGW